MTAKKGVVVMIALITGVTSGFGLAIARRLIKENIKVIGLARRLNKLQDLAIELGENFFPLNVDITQAVELKAKLENLPHHFQAINILINNAGLALGLGPAYTANLNDWNIMVQTNINGVLNCTHHVLPKMVERNNGIIINLGSIAGDIPYPGGNVYGATKAFLKQFTLNLKADLLGTAIRVTNIEPGLCGGTEFSTIRFHGDQQKADSVYAGTNPLTAEDIAETVSWIVHLPARININSIAMMPVCQSYSSLAVNRSII